jgi:hypothetical protein
MIRDRTISLVVSPGALTIKTLGSIPSPATYSLFPRISYWDAFKKAEVYVLEHSALGVARYKQIKKKEIIYLEIDIYIYCYIFLPYTGGGQK